MDQFAITGLILLLISSFQFLREISNRQSRYNAEEYQDIRDNPYYIAGVVEFAGKCDPRPDNAIHNLKEYVKFIALAKGQNVDIVVFPEIGITGHGQPLDTMAHDIPDPRNYITPCDDIYSSRILHDVSCAARDYSIYVVMNIPEKSACENTTNCRKEGWLMYNTNIAFDRLGRLVARYRKFNLFGEDYYQITDRPERSIFVTDFGVKFGMFVCFDIFFERPALELVFDFGITDFVYSTAWYLIYPYLTAIQVQSGWAYNHDVNLLAAEFNDPAVGTTGSGIHLGRLGTAAYAVTNDHETKLIVAAVPKKRPRPTAREHQFTMHQNKQRMKPKCWAIAGCDDENFELYNVTRNGQVFQWRKDNLRKYSSELIAGPSFNRKVCYGAFCCKFRVEYKPFQGIRYRAIVFKGIESLVDIATDGEQSCGIVACSDVTVESCLPGVDTSGVFLKYVSIEGMFENYRATFQPSIMTSSFGPIPVKNYRLTAEESGSKMNLALEIIRPIQDVNVFGLYGRIFTLDGFTLTPNFTKLERLVPGK